MRGISVKYSSESTQIPTVTFDTSTQVVTKRQQIKGVLLITPIPNIHFFVGFNPKTPRSFLSLSPWSSSFLKFKLTVSSSLDQDSKDGGERRRDIGD